MKKTLKQQQQQEPPTDDGLQAGQLFQAFVDMSTVYVEE